MKLQRCISLDPPWWEKGGGKIKRGADRRYKNERAHDIIRIIYQSGVWNPDPAGCHVWLWCTNTHFNNGNGSLVMKALGVRQINHLTWGKVKDGRVQKGIGQYFFGSSEPCIFGVIGRLRAQNRVPTFFEAERTPIHSEKPALAYEMMETVSPGPRLEMFATERRKGWKTWGPENHRGEALL